MEINQDAWCLWLDVATQWRSAGMAIIGLDYAEVRQSARDLDIPYTTRNKKKIQAMEREYLSLVNSTDQ